MVALRQGCVGGGVAMKTVRLTMRQALVRWLCAQRTVIDDTEQPLFG
jgi:TPP-dependent trihydroxycyclohexane-1,2-dione (THcHDO) dehydratase